MSAEMVGEKAEFGKKPGFFRSFVEKIRDIDVKWILAGAVGAIAGGLVAHSFHVPILPWVGLGLGLGAVTYVIFGTDSLEISSSR